MAAPLAAAQLAQMGMGLTDTVLLGALGRDALAAGGLGASIFFTATALIQGSLAAVGILVARARGANTLERIAPILRSGILLATLAAVPLMLVLWWVEPFLLFIGEPAGLARDAATYVRILFWATPATMWLATQRTYLAAMGFPKLIMTVAGGALIINGFLTYGLIHGVGGLPEMGFSGSAIASTFTLWCMLGVTALSIRFVPMLRLHRLRGPIEWHSVRELFHLGWPIAATWGAEITLFLVAALMMGMLGNTAMAAHQIAISIASVTFMIPMACAQTANVRVSYFMGANDRRASRRAGLAAFVIGVGFMAFAAAILFIAPLQITLLFNLNPVSPVDAEVIALVVHLLAICAFFQVFDGAQTIAAGALRGYKDTRIPMMLATLCYWGVGFPTAWVLGFPMGYGPTGIWSGLALGLAMAAILLGTRFHRLSRRKAELTARP
jgi:MATE family multidrug resistance protein